jgi:sugar phosphate permease
MAESSEPTSSLTFQACRIAIYTNMVILYAIVMFQRACPSIVAADMALDYGVEKSELGIFSSIFFWSYGLIQPFTGMLCDIVEPAFLIGGSQLLAAFGAVICGFSQSLAVGCVGRFFVGLGCGPTFVPLSRSLVGWFPLSMYATMNGLTMAIGGVGGVIAQGPLATLTGSIGWRWSFYVVGIFGAFFAILCLIFVRGSPELLGFPPVNKHLAASSTVGLALQSRLAILWENLKTVISLKWFWVAALHVMLFNGPWYNLNGMWIAPFLEDVYGYAKQDAGNASMWLSIGLIIGGIIFPPISTFLRTRKWVLFATTLSACAIILSFALVEAGKASYAVVCFMLTVFGACTCPMTSVVFSLMREYYNPSVAGTAVGCGNTLIFIASAIFQSITAEIIGDYKQDPDAEVAKYTAEGYDRALWWMSVALLIAAAIAVALAKDTEFGRVEAAEDEDEMKEEGKTGRGDDEDDAENPVGGEGGEKTETERPVDDAVDSGRPPDNPGEEVKEDAGAGAEVPSGV